MGTFARLLLVIGPWYYGPNISFIVILEPQVLVNIISIYRPILIKE
uniref:Transmembrane protein n=1 Tax=Marseillevirus LCMAC102 TaxID=2506603 RepID=A0A481YVL0_9VIRU|nr:MAG: hypothetical protein LCMAC102_03790 [Marseillevirus LCMAC102]